MAEYIEREAAIELLSQPITMSMCLSTEECHHKIAQQRIDRYLIENIPAADVRPVVRAEWYGEADGYADGGLVYDMWSCPICGKRFEEWEEKPDWNFCPNCGADMREES